MIPTKNKITFDTSSLNSDAEQCWKIGCCCCCWFVFVFFNEGTQFQRAAPKSCIRCHSFQLRTSITLQASPLMLSHYYALYESVICHACCDLAQFLILWTPFGTRVKLSFNSWTIRILSQSFENLMDGRI